MQVGDFKGLERLALYMHRCPFSLARMIRVTDKGQMIERQPASLKLTS